MVGGSLVLSFYALRPQVSGVQTRKHGREGRELQDSESFSQVCTTESLFSMERYQQMILVNEA